MPRCTITRVSISSEHSTNSDHSDNLSINEELPDPGLPKTNGKDAKEKKKVYFDFPIEVIIKRSQFTGIGSIGIVKTKSSLEKSVSNTKEADLKTVLLDFDQEVLIPDEKRVASPKRKNDAKCQRKPPSVVKCVSKKEAAKEAKLSKEAKKKELEAKRETIKQAIEDERAAKAEFEVINKIYKPAECVKFLHIMMHPALANAWYMIDTVREVTTIGAVVSPTDTITENGLIVWMRRIPPTLESGGERFRVSAMNQRGPRSLYVLPAEHVPLFVEKDDIDARVANLRAIAGTSITFLIFGASDAYKHSHGNGSQRLSRAKLKEMITELQLTLIVYHHIDLLEVETPMELASLVVNYTRAVGEAPYKKAKRDFDEQAEFYMRGDNKNCVTVDKDGNGLSRLWEQMLAVLPQSSLEVARTLGAEYKNPSGLLQEFQNDDGIATVADIGITRANVPGARSRRLGPEFARKLHTLFTTEDGDTVIE